MIHPCHHPDSSHPILECNSVNTLLTCGVSSGDWFRSTAIPIDSYSHSFPLTSINERDLHNENNDDNNNNGLGDKHDNDDSTTQSSSENNSILLSDHSSGLHSNWTKHTMSHSYSGQAHRSRGCILSPGATTPAGSTTPSSYMTGGDTMSFGEKLRKQFVDQTAGFVDLMFCCSYSNQQLYSETQEQQELPPAEVDVRLRATSEAVDDNSVVDSVWLRNMRKSVRLPNSFGEELASPDTWQESNQGNYVYLRPRPQSSNHDDSKDDIHSELVETPSMYRVPPPPAPMWDDDDEEWLIKMSQRQNKKKRRGSKATTTTRRRTDHSTPPDSPCSTQMTATTISMNSFSSGTTDMNSPAMSDHDQQRASTLWLLHTSSADNNWDRYERPQSHKLLTTMHQQQHPHQQHQQSLPTRQIIPSTPATAATATTVTVSTTTVAGQGMMRPSGVDDFLDCDEHSEYWLITTGQLRRTRRHHEHDPTLVLSDKSFLYNGNDDDDHHMDDDIQRSFSKIRTQLPYLTVTEGYTI